MILILNYSFSPFTYNSDYDNTESIVFDRFEQRSMVSLVNLHICSGQLFNTSEKKIKTNISI